MNLAPRVLLAAALVLMTGVACSSTKHAATTTSSAAAVTTVPATVPLPTTTGGATETTSSSRPTNLVTTDAVRAALVAAFARSQNLAAKYVAGTVKGSVYYAYDPASRAYWAVADFSPTAAARQVDQHLQGRQRDPLIYFQDGPWVFTERAGSAWRLVAQTGGRLCPPRPPAAVLALWGNRAIGCT